MGSMAQGKLKVEINGFGCLEIAVDEEGVRCASTEATPQITCDAPTAMRAALRTSVAGICLDVASRRGAAARLMVSTSALLAQARRRIGNICSATVPEEPDHNPIRESLEIEGGRYARYPDRSANPLGKNLKKMLHSLCS